MREKAFQPPLCLAHCPRGIAFSGTVLTSVQNCLPADSGVMAAKSLTVEANLAHR